MQKREDDDYLRAILNGDDYPPAPQGETGIYSPERHIWRVERRLDSLVSHAARQEIATIIIGAVVVMLLVWAVVS